MTGPDWTGRTFEVTVGAVGHGGFCVARHEGRVVFVRHCIPGERVRARVTEDRGGSFCRADAAEILLAAPERVRPPCPVAGPGGCGGCDFQHVALDTQRRWKAGVVAEQLRRLGGLERAVEVEELPGGERGLGWRGRVRLAVGPDGRAGLHGHRSHEVIALDHCPQAAPGVLDGVLEDRWTPGAEVAAVLDADGAQHVVELVEAGTPATGRGRRRSGRARTRPRLVRGSERAVQRGAGREFPVLATGFWQGHVAAADVYAGVVADWARAPVGGTAWDLYGGVGLFAAVLADQVGAGGRVISVESSRLAAADGAAALADLRQVDTVVGTVESRLQALPCPVDVVVLDPPRSGAGAAVVAGICAAAPARVVYVACDPAALGRDVGLFGTQGYALSGLRAFDAFPMTHHVECIALFTPAQFTPAQFTPAQFTPAQFTPARVSG